MSRTYEVQARWDSEAGVWVAESDDIPGLVAEAESMNALVEKVRAGWRRASSALRFDANQPRGT